MHIKGVMAKKKVRGKYCNLCGCYQVYRVEKRGYPKDTEQCVKCGTYKFKEQVEE